jgi:hypothetical protein
MLSKRRCPHTGVVNFFFAADPHLAVGSVIKGERRATCGGATPTHARLPARCWICRQRSAASLSFAAGRPQHRRTSLTRRKDDADSYTN